MRYTNFLSIVFIFLMGSITSCEEIINVPLKDSESVLVVEGNIDDYHLRHEIVLTETTSFSYLGQGKPVSGARVMVSENGKNGILLKEKGAGHYVLSNFIGVSGRKYYLHISKDGKAYEAYSSMPEPVRIDSVGTIEVNFLGETKKSLAVIFQDPPHVKNYYRLKARISGRDKESFWVFDDKFKDGKSITQALNDFSLTLTKNDTVSIEFQCIDSAVYTFWKGVQEQGTPGGTTPANPVSNLSNGALGYFSAHSISASVFVVE